MENGSSSKNKRQNYQMIQKSHFWAYTQKNSLNSFQSSIIHDSQRMSATQVSMDRQMDKQNMVYAYNEYYSSLKMKEILTHATIWINLKDIMLSEISQSQKHKYYESTYMRYQ